MRVNTSSNMSISQLARQQIVFTSDLCEYLFQHVDLAAINNQQIVSSLPQKRVNTSSNMSISQLARRQIVSQICCEYLFQDVEFATKQQIVLTSDACVYLFKHVDFAAVTNQQIVPSLSQTRLKASSNTFSLQM